MSRVASRNCIGRLQTGPPKTAPYSLTESARCPFQDGKSGDRRDDFRCSCDIDRCLVMIGDFQSKGNFPSVPRRPSAGVPGVQPEMEKKAPSVSE
jgi:hypothetical protein